MTIAAFLQLHNELDKGNLERCLHHVQRWADSIFIYDDGSTDDSFEVYRQHTPESRIILGERNDFGNEIAHKQQLLGLVQAEGHWDWIVWIDGDAVLDSYLEHSIRHYMQTAESNGCDALTAHYLNLWRHPAFYRLDNSFNDLHCCFAWKNKPELRYDSRPGLHQTQYPLGIGRMLDTSNEILHYGFASVEAIQRKYLTYKSHGQSGWALDRLVDESGMKLAKVARETYPGGLLPEDYSVAALPPTRDYAEVRGFNSWEEFSGRKA